MDKECRFYGTGISNGKISGKIKFLDIPKLVEAAINAQPGVENYSLEDVFEADRRARKLVLEMSN